ncbi:MAG: hypothetical protein P8R42_00750 [Candidatus Binatia bacterium]|nr:hypothetical protein [Candidatus Binatia bacterium]
MTPSPSRALARRSFALAALAYLGVALWVLAAPLADPTRLLPANGSIDSAVRGLGRLDQQMVVSVIVRNAAVLTGEPWNFFGDGQCYPLPRSYTLGEHMFGEGVLAAVPWLVTGDPVLTYNLLVVLTFWLPGLAMYALSYHFTRSAPAAFLAGLIFLLVPPRIIDGGHPYLYADYFVPLALLFLHRLFARGGWGNALGVAFFLTLQSLETIYVLLATALVVGVYGSFGLVAYRHRLRGVVAPLIGAAVVSVSFAWFFLSPYLETAEMWGVLSGRETILMALSDYLPGHVYFPGLISLGLVGVALADRLRGPRRTDGEDPRVAYLTAGLVVVWASSNGFEIPGTSVRFPGLFPLLRDVVPGLGAVRGLFAVAVGIWVPIAFLAGYGVVAVLERRPRAVVVVAVAAVSLAVVAERFVAPVGTWSFGRPLALIGWDVDVSADDVALLRRVGHGAALHVPMAKVSNGVGRLAMARYLLLQSYDPRPSSACYNSFASPLNDQVHHLAVGLPSVASAEALGALGFGSVLSHEKDWYRAERVRFQKKLDRQPEGRRALTDLGGTDALRGFRLETRTEVFEAPDRLTIGLGSSSGKLAPGRADLALEFQNPTGATYRHAPPIRPTEVTVQWYRRGERVGPAQTQRVVLPIAIGPGGSLTVPVPVEVPVSPGRYEIEVSAGVPSRALVLGPIDVASPAGAKPSA